MKLGGSSIQTTVTSTMQACLAQIWATVLDDLITCEIENELNKEESPIISCKIGATTAREPAREFQRSTISKQSTSSFTRV
jgi:hypothetical protein